MADGKVDVVRLTELAKENDPVRAALLAQRPAKGQRHADRAEPAADQMLTAVRQAWQEALGHDRAIDPDTGFFDIGGDSLNLLQVHASLQRLPGVEVTMQDLYRNQTVATQASFLRAQSQSANGGSR
jgi:aryl carrier-like protein